MNVVIVTLLARPRKKLEEVDYFTGFWHLVQSLKRHNRIVPPIVVMSPDLDAPPNGADRLVRIDERMFDGIDMVQMAFGKSVYFKLNLFRLNECGLDVDRVVYFDCDMIALASVNSLWDLNRLNEHSIHGVRESAELGLTNPDWRGRLNAGLLVVNRPMLDARVFDTMIALARSGKTYDHGDQGVINAWLTEFDKWSDVGELPPEFNMPSCVRTQGDWEKFAGRIRCLHFAGPRKPWRDRPDHEWHHPETQQLWDDEVAHHRPLPKKGRPGLSSSLHTRLVRLVQRYEVWRGK